MLEEIRTAASARLAVAREQIELVDGCARIRGGRSLTFAELAADGLRVDTEFANNNRLTYTYGSAPDETGVSAAVSLASEIGKAETGDSSCRLPKRVTSITRQGISVAVIDSMDFFKISKTGIPEIDLWLTSVNPKARRRRARVFSPDIPRMQ